MTKRLLTTSGLVLALVLLFAVNIVSGQLFGSSRIDLTEQEIYTLTEGTHDTLRALEEPVQLRLYLSERLVTRLPGISGYANRVKDLLKEYQRVSDGKVRVQIIDPEPFSDEEDRAVAFGMRGVPIQSGDEVFYFGIVGTNALDDEEVIPFLSTNREQLIEYDLTRLVYRLGHTKSTVVGLLSTLPIEGAGPQAALRGLSQPPWMVLEQLRELVEIESLDPSMSAVPDDVDVLMLVHPKGLPQSALYAIDQFVLSGGRALVFVDPLSEGDRGAMPGGLPVLGGPSKRSDLAPLLKAWGLELAADKVVGDIQSAIKVRMQRGARILTIDYPVWISIRQNNLNADDIVTAELGNVSLGTSGYLKTLDDATTQTEALITATQGAALYDAASVAIVADPEQLLRDYKPLDETFVLAARVSGKVKSAFPDGPPPEPDRSSEQTGGDEQEEQKVQDANPTPHLSASKEDVNLIIVADTDFLQDQFWVQVQDLLGTRIAVPTAANGQFVANALDNLSGSNELISVRNRGSFIRPFDRVDQLREQAELEFRQKEEQLIGRLEETEEKLLTLEDQKQGDDALILNDAQRAELVEFRQERLRVRKELRDVRRDLRRNIEQLEGWIKFLNIGAMPIFIGIVGLIAGIAQMQRRGVALKRDPA